MFTNKLGLVKTWLWNGRGNHLRTFGLHDNFLQTQAENKQNQQKSPGKRDFSFTGGTDSQGCDWTQSPSCKSSSALLQMVFFSHLGWKFLGLLFRKATPKTHRGNLDPLAAVGDWPSAPADPSLCPWCSFAALSSTSAPSRPHPVFGIGLYLVFFVEEATHSCCEVPASTGWCHSAFCQAF